MTTIQTRGLTRRFQSGGGEVNAVRGVDLDVESGQIVGFLGPNGAGKTTTLRMLATLLRPTAGTAEIAGADLIRDPVTVRRRIGYIAQSSGTDPGCLVHEEIYDQGRLYRLGGAEARSRTRQLLGEFDLLTIADRPVRTLSGGQRRRLDIAMGLVHSPQVLLLDEPTSGLDPQSRGNVWDHVLALRADRGTTILLTTHYLEEADALCDRIFVIDHGRIVTWGSPDELKRRIAGDLLTVEVFRDPDLAKSTLAGLPGVREVAVSELTVRLVVESGEHAVIDVMRALDAADVPTRSIQISRPSLDDVFFAVTGRTLRDGDQAVQAPADTATEEEA
jgi:ABC-2 type transport system ATP-binding protein